VVAAGSLDGVLSVAVFEHLHAPWVAAAEINRALRSGGVVYHRAPTAWPEHSLPNDFWRFTQGGLALLFGPDTGFEVLATSADDFARVVPDPGWRRGFLDMPTVRAAAMSSILARKVRDLPEDAVRWVTDPATDAARARQYPLAGLASW
jgi:SAM-dependent methyltransferase